MASHSRIVDKRVEPSEVPLELAGEPGHAVGQGDIQLETDSLDAAPSNHCQSTATMTLLALMTA